MTFKLKPGDFIRVANVPEEHYQNVIDAFVRAGAKNNLNYEKHHFYWRENTGFAFWDASGNTTNPIFRDASGIFNICGEIFAKDNTLYREVTLDQVLGKPMQIEDNEAHWSQVGPELLRAAENVLRLIEHPSVEHDETLPQIVELDEAIAKAKGAS